MISEKITIFVPLLEIISRFEAILSIIFFDTNYYEKSNQRKRYIED